MRQSHPIRVSINPMLTQTISRFRILSDAKFLLSKAMKVKAEISEREILQKILSIVEGRSYNGEDVGRMIVYDNKSLMALLNIKDKYLKKLRDYGYIGYSREGDKYWYTQEDVSRFLKRFHYAPFSNAECLPPQ